MENNFNLKKYLAEGRLLKEALSVNQSGKLSNNDEDDILTEDEWIEFKTEYDKNFKLNWLIRQLTILDGEEEKTKYAWNYSIPQIEAEFKATPEAASIIFDIFQILKTTITHWTSLPDEEYSQYRHEIDDILDNMTSDEAIEFMKHPEQVEKNKLLRTLTNDLYEEYATPQELLYLNPQAWDAMAYYDIDQYDWYVDDNL
jgi:hypothetical protein